MIGKYWQQKQGQSGKRNGKTDRNALKLKVNTGKTEKGWYAEGT